MRLRCEAPTAGIGGFGARLGAALHRTRARPIPAAGRRLLRAQARDCCEERDTENGRPEIVFFMSASFATGASERAPLYLAMSQLGIERIEDTWAAAAL